MERGSFLIYRSFAEVMCDLSDEDAGRLFKAISAYALDGEEPELSGTLSGYFKLMKPQFDANRQKYENGCKSKTKTKPNEEQVGSKPEAKQKQTRSKTEANQKLNGANENDNENDNDKCIKKNTSKEVLKEKRFAPPSLDEVTQYCNERENGIDPQRFIDFYESKGWMIGKNKMKDWKAAVRSWESRDKPPAKESKPITWGTMIYDPAEEQHPPRFGFPAEWFNGNTLITESVRNVIHPKDTSKGLYEAFEVKAPELINLFKLRRDYYEQHYSE